MEREATLPQDDWVEMIISMLPFPAIFQVPCLSKTWQARFSSTPADDEEAVRCLAPSFQEKVIKQSKTWGTIWPLFISKGLLLGYDRASQAWRTMPSLSFLPEAAGVPQAFCAPLGSRVQIEGALLFTWAKTLPRNCNLYVANILTRRWKALALPPLLTERVLFRKLIIGKSSKSYKVILLGYLPGWDQERFGSHTELISIQIYDSESDAWRRSFWEGLDWNFNPTTAVHLDGVLYTVLPSRPLDLLAYNLEEGTLKCIVLAEKNFRLAGRIFQIEAVELVIDKAGLMIVTVWDFFSPRYRYYQEDGSKYIRQWKSRVVVLRIDLKSGRLLLLAHSPPVHLKLRNTECIMDGNCINFGMEESGSRQVCQYNVDTNEWNHLQAPPGYKWLGYCFEPGMNPFMAV